MHGTLFSDFPGLMISRACGNPDTAMLFLKIKKNIAIYLIPFIVINLMKIFFHNIYGRSSFKILSCELGIDHAKPTDKVASKNSTVFLCLIVT